MHYVYIIAAAIVCLPCGRKIPFLTQQYFLQFSEEKDAFAVLVLSSITKPQVGGGGVVCVSQGGTKVGNWSANKDNQTFHMWNLFCVLLKLGLK